MLLLLVCLPNAGCAQPQELDAVVSAGAAEADSREWDFGEVKAGEVLGHEFPCKNLTTTTLHIKEISTSCGCTVSEVEKRELLPGEETFIKVIFKSEGYKGAVKQYVYAHTDDVDNPVIRYIIKATVVP